MLPRKYPIHLDLNSVRIQAAYSEAVAQPPALKSIKPAGK